MFRSGPVRSGSRKKPVLIIRSGPVQKSGPEFLKILCRKKLRIGPWDPLRWIQRQKLWGVRQFSTPTEL